MSPICAAVPCFGKVALFELDFDDQPACSLAQRIRSHDCAGHGERVRQVLLTEKLTSGAFEPLQADQPVALTIDDNPMLLPIWKQFALIKQQRQSGEVFVQNRLTNEPAGQAGELSYVDWHMSAESDPVVAGKYQFIPSKAMQPP
jgi:hypothetical protein